MTPVPSQLLRRAAGLVAAVLAGALTLSALSACSGSTPAAASVNGRTVSDASLTDELRQISANPLYVTAIQQSTGGNVSGKGKAGTFDLAFTDKVLDREILLELVHEEFVKRNLVVTPSALQDAQAAQSTQLGNDQATGKPIFPGFSKAYQDLLTRRAAEVTALGDALAGVTVSDATVQSYYNAHTASYQLNCVSVIQVASKAAADQAEAKAVVPGADFAALARQTSTDAQSAAQGGAIGCQPAGTYSQLPGVDAAIAALSVGGVSKVVNVQGTFAVFKLTDRKPQALSAVRGRVVSALHNQGSAKLTQFVQDRVTKAKVTISSRYGTWKSTGPNLPPGVVPPNAPPASAGGSATTAPATAPPTTGP
jgi:parvulin-like peptidyl-prolyl isomerase